MNIPTKIASSDAITTDKEQFWKEHAKHQLERGKTLPKVLAVICEK